LKRFFVLISACGLLAACGDPLSRVDKLSSVDLAEDTPIVSALPDPAQQVRTRGLFSGLFRRDAAPEPVTDVQTDAAVSAAPAIAAPQTPERRGLFGFLRAKEAQQPTAPVAQIAAAPRAEVALPLEQTIAVEPEKVAAVTQPVPEATSQPRRGLFGLLAGARAKEKEQTSDAVQVRTAALTPTLKPRGLTENTPRRNNRTRKHKGPDAQIVPFGTTLPSGVVARVCDLPAGRLGKQIEKFPARGNGYKLIDSKPGSERTRPFYVTGFDDNCARTFTAALALFGSPTMHEQLRYGLPSKVQPYSLTDRAYEGIKRSVCGVAKNKSCGAKISKLEKNTVFVSIYDRIGSNASWSNILIHDGWVLAADRKG